MEAGPNPHGWNFYKLSVREQEEKGRVEICSVSPLRLRFLGTLIHNLLLFVGSSKLQTLRGYVRKWPGKTMQWKKGFKVYEKKWRVPDVTQEAVLDIAWRKILMSVHGTLQRWHTQKLKHRVLSGHERRIISFSCRGDGPQDTLSSDCFVPRDRLLPPSPLFSPPSSMTHFVNWGCFVINTPLTWFVMLTANSGFH